MGWSKIGSALLNFLNVAWKPLALMVAGVFIAHFLWYGPRIDNLKLELSLEEKQTEYLEGVIESQNKAIENASDVSQETFNDMLEQLSKTIDRDSKDTNELIQKIIEAGVPEGCADSALFLVEQIDNLEWEESRNE